jgi:membrane-associated phospholipid phosphatase
MTDMPDASPGSSTTLGEPSAPRDVHLALAGASMAVLFAATLLLVDHRWAPLLRADQSARRSALLRINHPGFVQAMQVISASGSAVAWVAILSPVVLSLLWRRLPRLALFVVVAALGSALLNVVVKTVVHRPRPLLSDPVARAHGLSFPSAHA